MRDAGYTKQERSLLTLIRVLMVLFFLATVLFIIAPDWTLNYVAAIGRGIFGFTEPQVKISAERFWLVLSIAYMSAITYVAFVAQHDFLRNIDYIKIIIISKFISSAGFLYCFIVVEHRFFYLVGLVIDGLIFVLSLYYYSAAIKSRAR